MVSPSRLSTVVSLAGLAACVAALSLTNIHDLDFGFYLATGRYLLQHGPPRNEFFVPLLSDQPFSSPWLLSAVLFALAWNAAGPAGLILLKAVCYTGGFLLAAAAAIRRGVAPPLACLIVGLGACAVAPRLVERPGFFSVLLMGWVLWAFASGLSQRRYAPLLLPLLFPVWALLHAEWYIGLALYAALAVSYPWSRSKKIMSLLAALMYPFAAAFLHPSGPRPMIAPLFLLVGGQADFGILEYQPAAWRSLWPAIPLLVATLGAGIWLIRRGRAPEGMLLVALVLLCIRIPRGVLPALVIGTPALAEWVSAIADRDTRLSPLFRAQPTTRWAILAAILLAALGIWRTDSLPYRHFGLGIHPTLDTRGIGAVLDGIPEREGPLLAEYGYSSLLLSNPSVVRQGVIADGRQEAYSPQYFERVYLDLFRGGSGWGMGAKLLNSGTAFYAESFRDATRQNMIPALESTGWSLIGWDDSGRLMASHDVVTKYRLRVYEFDPARVGDLQGQPPEVLNRAREEATIRIAELRAAGIPAARALLFKAQLLLGTGDVDGAARYLAEAEGDGADVLVEYWRTLMSLATLTGDDAMARRAMKEISRFPVVEKKDSRTN